MATSSFNIHPLSIQVCTVLQDAGYQAYIVGGCVRDLHLGLTPMDWDITTSALPEQVIKLFPNTIPTGLQHGTVTVCLDKRVENHFEVTTFRTEEQYLDGRRPENVSFVNDIVQDLSRRDFTINAMAYDPINHQLIDPFDGLRDLETKTIRAVGDANQRFQEDGLRIMRAARFAARFGYQIETQTFEGMRDNLETLRKISKERISDELRKILMAEHHSLGLQLLSDCYALDIICPLLFSLPISRAEVLPYPKYYGALETRLAALYNGLSVAEVSKELLGLKMSSKEVKRTILLLIILEQFLSASYSNPDYKNMIAFLKNDTIDTYQYSLDQFIELAKTLQLPTQQLLDQCQNTVVYARKELAINGDDLIAQGITAGPQLKKLLYACYQHILECPEDNDKEFLLQWVTEI